MENKVRDDNRLYNVSKLYPLLCRSGCLQRTEVCSVNATEDQLSASALSAASGELFFMYNEHGCAGGLVILLRLEAENCLKPTTTCSGHVICCAVCTCTTWLLLHVGLKGAFNHSNPPTGLQVFFPFVCYHGYTQMDAEITFPPCFFFFTSLPLSVLFFSREFHLM